MNAALRAVVFAAAVAAGLWPAVALHAFPPEELPAPAGHPDERRDSKPDRAIDTMRARDQMERSRERARRGLQHPEVPGDPAASSTTTETPGVSSDRLRSLGTRAREQQGEGTRTRDTADDPRDAPVETPPIHSTPPPPVIYGEELEGQDLCCRLQGRLLGWPRTTDPLQPPAEQEAPQDPAIGGHNVLLHDGSLIHQDNDLLVAAVGFPFQLNHTYRSNIKTESGGLLGHKWDFNLNRRIVPIPARSAANGLVVEIVGSDTPALMLYDGHGRADRHAGKQTDLRTVRNYGQTFKAVVTIYESPPGLFHEIQRYVLLDGEPHPFAEHPNVEKTERIFYVQRTGDGTLYVYNCRGQMIYILDRHGNRMTFVYGGAWNPLTQNRMLSEIRDTADRIYAVATVDIQQGTVMTNVECKLFTGTFPIPRIKRITDFAGRAVVFQYEAFDTRPVLESVTREFGRDHMRTKYAYQGGEDYELATVTAPREAAANGPPRQSNVFRDKKVVSQRVGEASIVLDHRDQGCAITDGNGNRRDVTLEKVAAGKVIRTLELRGAAGPDRGPWTTRYQHDPSSLLRTITLPAGNRVSFDYAGTGGPLIGLGPNRDWVERDWTWPSDLAAGNLLGITRESHLAGDKPKSIRVRYSYDKLFNQLASVTDPLGKRTEHKYRYDGGTGYNGKPYETRLPDLTRPRGGPLTNLVERFTYLQNGLLETATDTAGRVTRFDYAPKTGYLTSIAAPGGTRRFTFDERGNVLTATTPAGVVSRFEYDLRDLVKVSVDDDGGFANRTEYRYDLNGNLSRRKVERTDNFDDKAGTPKPTGVGDTDIIEDVKYDILDRLAESTVSGGDIRLTTTLKYDRNGNLEQRDEPAPADGGRLVTRYAYDGRDLAFSETVEGGGLTAARTFARDRNGNLLTAVAPSGATTSYEYDGFDREVARVNPLGARSAFALDAAGRPAGLTVTGDDGRGQSRATLLEAAFRYDELGHQIEESQALLGGGGKVSTFWLLNRGLQVAEILGPGRGATKHVYDQAGRLAEVIDAVGNRTINRYDADGNRVGITDEEVDRRRAPNGQWIEGKLAVAWQFEFDALGRIVRTTGPHGAVRSFYDSQGNLRGAVDERGILTSFLYDGLGRQQRLQANGVVEDYSRAPGGALLEVKSPLRHLKIGYDGFGRVVSQTDAKAGGTTTFQLDDAGNAATTTDPNGTRITRRFNALGLPLSATIAYGPNGRPAGGRQVPTLVGPFRETYAYDALGRPVRSENDSGGGTAVELAYDGLGHVIRDAQTFGGNIHVVESVYEADLSRRTVTYPAVTELGAVAYGLDALGRVARVEADGAAAAIYEYAGRQRLAERWAANAVRSLYRWDDKHRLIELRTVNAPRFDIAKPLWSSRAGYGAGPEPASLAKFVLADDRQQEAIEIASRFDRLGRPVETVTGHGRLQAAGRPATAERTILRRSYDRDGRLAAMTEILYDELAPRDKGETGVVALLRDDRFEYGKSGRIDATFTRARENMRSGLDELERTGTAVAADAAPFQRREAFVYDKNGNLIADDRFVYAYDHRNRLTRIHDTWSRHEEAVLFRYDNLGRRVAQDHIQPPTGTGFVQWGTGYWADLRFLYDGAQTIAEILNGHPDHPGPVLLARYVPGARPHEIVRMDRRVNDAPGGRLASFYLHEGIEGTVEFLTDDAARLLQVQGLDPPAAARTGAATSPPGDRHMIVGTRTRAPYVARGTRIDSFAGVTFDERLGRSVFEYRAAHALSRDMALTKYRESISRMQSRGLVALGALTVAPFALASTPALLQGALGLALDFGVATHTQSGYSAAEGARAFLLATFSARLGAAVPMSLQPGLNGLVRNMAADFAADLALGTYLDVSLNNRTLSEAVAGNLASSAMSSAIGAGVHGGRLALGKAVPYVAAKVRQLRAASEAPPNRPIEYASNGGRAPRAHPANGARASRGTCKLCFAAGTRVRTEQGWRNIEAVRAGDRVWARDEISGREGFRRVEAAHVTAPRAFVHLHYRIDDRHRRAPRVAVHRVAARDGDRAAAGDGGDEPDPDPDAPHVLVGTPTHPVWSVDRAAWIGMADLRPGERLSLAGGGLASVERIAWRRAPAGESFTAYNLTVEGWHSYFASPAGSRDGRAAVWVHNTSAGSFDCRYALPFEPEPADIRGWILKLGADYRKMSSTERGRLKEWLRANHSDMVLYRGFAKPVAQDPYLSGQWGMITSHIGDALRPGRVPVRARGDKAGSRYVEQDVLEAHVLNQELGKKSGATSWTTEVAVAQRFSGRAGNRPGVILSIKVHEIIDRVLAYPPNLAAKYGELEILLDTRDRFMADAVSHQRYPQRPAD